MSPIPLTPFYRGCANVERAERELLQPRPRLGGFVFLAGGLSLRTLLPSPFPSKYRAIVIGFLICFTCNQTMLKKAISGPFFEIFVLPIIPCVSHTKIYKIFKLGDMPLAVFVAYAYDCSTSEIYLGVGTDME